MFDIFRQNVLLKEKVNVGFKEYVSIYWSSLFEDNLSTFTFYAIVVV